MSDTAAFLTILARKALHLNQRELAEFLGAALRTVQRWDAGQSQPARSDMAKLAAAVHPEDPALAARLAQHSGKTAEELGIHPKKDTPVDAPPRVAPERVAHLVSTVVCESADVLGVPPATARAALLAGLRKAAHLELTIEDLVSALGAATSTPAKGSGAGSKPAGRAR
ncbi:MAG: helix-turn-helix domain-containing protein [Polyangiaceae bacterium]